MKETTITERGTGRRFILSKGILKEDDHYPYIATKAQVRRTVNLKVREGTRVFYYLRRVGYRSRETKGYLSANATRIPSGVRLGCCFFIGKNFETLKRWANRR